MNPKSILITGAASGIGRAAALLFAKNGWFTGLFDVNGDALAALEAEIGPSRCVSGIMDVADPGSVKAGVDAFTARTGGTMDVLLNNAGILKFGLFEKTSLAEHHRIVSVNLNGCLSLIHLSLPSLKKTPGARIINLSSISSLHGVPELAVYSATKSALSAMTEALDIELEPYGIRVCDIRPPYVETPMLKDGNNVKSMRMMKLIGGRIKTDTVTNVIWKAAHGNRLHWNIGLTKLMLFQFWSLPFSKRFSLKLLTMPHVEVKR
jgi:NAD(P)-dependent dehydrogenase (short-subunit alcohol dehydrogenase family)